MKNRLAILLPAVLLHAGPALAQDEAAEAIGTGVGLVIGLLIAIVIGAIVGWLAGLIVKGGGSTTQGNSRLHKRTFGNKNDLRNCTIYSRIRSR